MITFIYKGNKITTPNLEKKLKRMKISINDIEIIPETLKEVPKEEPEIWFHCYAWNPLQRTFLISSFHTLDKVKEWYSIPLKNHIKLKGIPKFPVGEFPEIEKAWL